MPTTRRPEDFDRRNRCYQHRSIVRVPRGWRCDACDIASVTLPGEITPVVTWLDAPEPDPIYRRRLVDGATGALVLKDSDAPTYAAAWAACEPATKRRSRRIDTRGWAIEVIDPEPIAHLRAEWDAAWYRFDGDIIHHGDGVTFTVSLASDDDTVVVEVDHKIPPLRAPRYPVGGSVADIRRWRQQRGGVCAPTSGEVGANA